MTVRHFTATFTEQTSRSEIGSSIRSLLTSRLKELTACQLLLLSNYPLWAPLFTVYIFSYYLGSTVLPGRITRRFRRALSEMFGLRVLRLTPYERTAFFCDLDSVFLVVAEYMRGRTDSLLSFSDKVAIDLGAHYGMISQKLASKLGSAGHVFAVEASPPNYEVLRKNIALNALKNVSAFNCAVGDYSGTAQMIVDDGVSTHYRAVRTTSEGKLGPRVPCVRLAQLFDMFGIDRADLIKMDIEGSEIRVLRDSLSLLATSVRKLDIEVHRIEDVRPITRMLTSIGYDVSIHRAGILGGSHRIHARRDDEYTPRVA